MFRFPTSRFLLVAVVLLSFATAPSSTAQEVSENSDAREKEAANPNAGATGEDRAAIAKLIEGKDFEAALERIAPFIEKDPSDAFLLRLQGYSLLQTGKESEAIAALREATAAAPEDSAAHFFLGHALTTSGEPGEAVLSFLKVVELDPRSKYSEAVRAILPQLRTMIETEAMRPVEKPSGSPENPDAPLEQQYELVEILVPVEVPLPPPPPTQEELLLAAAMADIDSQRYDAALLKVEKLIGIFPANFQLKKLKAFVLTEKGDYESVIIYLGELKSNYPEDPALRLMIAQALSQDGQLKLAEAELIELIALQDPSTLAVAEKLLAEFDAAIRAIQKDKWSVYSTLGMEYDTNPQAIPVVGGGQGAESWRTSMSLSIGYEIIDQFRDEKPFSWVVNGSFFQTFHDNPDVRRLDVTLGSVGSYLRHDRFLMDRPLILTAGGDLGTYHLGGDGFYDYGNLYAGSDWRVLDNAGITLGYRFAHEEYANDTVLPELFSLDGDIHTGSIGGYAFLFQNKVLASASYRYTDSNREGSNFAAEVHAVNGSLRFYLPKGIELVAAAGYTNEDYTLFVPVPTRLDDIWNYSVSLEKELWVEGLKGVIRYSRTSAGSNQQFFNYEREI